eukprot:8577546-Ditylum_brightwellii.AAC.1
MVLGELEKEHEEEKKQKHQKALEEEEKKKQRKEDKRENKIKDREEALHLLPTLVNHLKIKGPSKVPKFTVPHLRMIIRYVIDDERGRQTNLNK